MSSSPELQIHMPAYNEQRYLSTAIDSVLADMEQSAIDFQLIIGNDVSTDGTGEILAGYERHPQIVVLTNPARLGCGGTHRAILEYTNQQPEKPYAISFRDADDISIPGASGKLLELLDSDDIGMVSGAKLEFTGDSPEDTSDATLRYRSNDMNQIVRGLLRGHVAVWNPSTIFRTESFTQAGFEYPTPSSCDDLAFQALMVFAGVQVANMPEPAVYYRKHPESMTTNWKPGNALPYLQTCMQIWEIAERERGIKPTPADRAYVFARAFAHLTTSKNSKLYSASRWVYHTGSDLVRHV